MDGLKSFPFTLLPLQVQPAGDPPTRETDVRLL
jgi:hypothetical protein